MTLPPAYARLLCCHGCTPAPRPAPERTRAARVRRRRTSPKEKEHMELNAKPRKSQEKLAEGLIPAVAYNKEKNVSLL